MLTQGAKRAQSAHAPSTEMPDCVFPDRHAFDIAASGIPSHYKIRRTVLRYIISDEWLPEMLGLEQG